MTEKRELSRTLVELANTLVADFDIVDFLHTLANRCADIFGAAEAGVMLADPRGVLRVVASSTERARLLELFEIQKEQGPCLESFRTGERVVARDPGDMNRWPLFREEALKVGFYAAYSLPLRFQANIIGALNLFRTSPGPLNEEDFAGAQAMADIATIGILQERAVRESTILAEQLQRALNSRVIIEQAKGVLAERLRVSLESAFNMMRTYSRNNNRRLHDVALAIVQNSIGSEELGKPRK